MRKISRKHKQKLTAALAFAGVLACCCATGTIAKTAAQETAAQETAAQETAAQETVPIPAYFNLAEQGKKPTVRSQGNTGTCWAISAVSAIESDLLPEKNILLSADHMSISNGFNIRQEDGGDYYMIMSYLADWKGPVPEEEDPYGDGVSPAGLKAALHVQEVRLLSGLSQDDIKRIILDHGAVQSSLCLNRERTDTDDYHYYNALTSAYFDPLMENVDHDILILGWDDTYSRDNFRIKPPGDGAWICQNTWGESFGEDGMFYVSYEDRNLLRQGGAAYSRIEDTDNYDHVYENDTLGWQGRQGYGKEGCWAAGAFTAEEDEELAAVGIYSTGPDTVCEVYVIPEFGGEADLKIMGGIKRNDQTGAGQDTFEEKEVKPGADPNVSEEEDMKTETDPDASEEEDMKTKTDPDASEGEGMKTTVEAAAAQMSMNTAGYFTIDLDKNIPLAKGQRFAVAVWIRTEQEDKPVAVEMIKDRYTENVLLDGRQTWISADGKNWDNTQEIYRTNICLKAYTRTAEERGTE